MQERSSIAVPRHNLEACAEIFHYTARHLLALPQKKLHPSTFYVCLNQYLPLWKAHCCVVRGWAVLLEATQLLPAEPFPCPCPQSYQEEAL